MMFYTTNMFYKQVKDTPQIRYFFIRSSLHLLIKRIKSYLNERKYKIPGFQYQ